MKLHFEPNLLEDFKAKLGRQGAPLTKKSIRSWLLKLSRFNAGTAARPGFSDSDIPAPDARGIASRDSSGKVLNAIAKKHPWLVGGSHRIFRLRLKRYSLFRMRLFAIMEIPVIYILTHDLI